MDPLVSVIVPVYNCEKYITRCLQSLQSQTYQNCRFILVNDGSTDGSLGIIQGFAAADSRFTVIDQPNGGVCAARTAGLNGAKGDYIAFADADDYVSPRFIQALVSAAEMTGADVAVCDYDAVYAARRDENILNLSDGVLDGPDAPRRYWLSCVAKAPVLWNKLYRRDLITRSGAFFAMKSGEDYLFNTAAAPYVERVALVGESLYSYVQRRDSLMRTPVGSKEAYTFINAFLDCQAGHEVYIKLGSDAYSLLAAMAFTGLLHSAEAIGQGAGFYRRQLYLLSGWSGYEAFCLDMAGGVSLRKLSENGAVGKKFAALMRPLFLPAALGLGGVTAAMLPAVARQIALRKREKSEDFV